MKQPKQDMNTLCKCGHGIDNHMVLDNRACHIMGCKCDGYSQSNQENSVDIDDKISYCNNCNCMTHTIEKTTCGKCYNLKVQAMRIGENLPEIAEALKETSSGLHQQDNPRKSFAPTQDSLNPEQNCLSCLHYGECNHIPESEEGCLGWVRPTLNDL